MSTSTADLLKLVGRLESVTSRLESVATVSGGKTNGAAPVTNGNYHEVTSSSTENFDSLPSIVAFDDAFTNEFASFKQLTSQIGGEVKTIVDMVNQVVQLERRFLIEAARCSSPTAAILQKFYPTVSKHMEEIQAYREKNRPSPLFNHLSAISEAIGAFGWISVAPAPSPFVKEMSDSAQFYTNRVLKDYKEKDQVHVQWARQWIRMLGSLATYVKQNHTTGVAWNTSKRGDTFDLQRVISASTDVSAPAGVAKKATSGPGGPPPPPPPPPMPNFGDLLAADDKEKPKGPSADALFAEINKGGTGITSGLKKVDQSQMTHKNPALRTASTVPDAVKTKSSTFGVKKPAPVVVQAPVCELVDKKWKVEFQTKQSAGQTPLTIDQTDLKHTVYIYKCSECTIVVKGKVNSILLDSCTRVALLFDDVLSTIEYINSKSCQMQVLGKCSSVIVEKTDGCQIYLSEKSLDCEIVSSKSSGMNVLVPSKKEDTDFDEQPVPEQYKTMFDPKSRKLVTVPTETA